MHITIRQFLVFQLWAVWQGGFLFYAGVVVPTGTDVLGSAVTQGFVTQEVTHWLNWLGCAFHLAFAWELAATRHRAWWRIRLALGLISLALLVALFALHPILDGYLNPAEQTIDRPREFYRWHTGYLWSSTVQWAIWLANASFTLAAWRSSPAIDRLPGV